MTRLEKTRVCPESCHPSLHMHHKTFITPEKPNQKKRYVFASAITMPEPKGIPRACYLIISEQPITDCVLLQFCSMATLKELEKKSVHRQTAHEVSVLWQRSFLRGPGKYNELLDKIRSGILTELEKHSLNKNYKPCTMKDIIKHAAESIYPPVPF